MLGPRGDREITSNYDRDERYGGELERGDWSFPTATTPKATRKKSTSCHSRLGEQRDREPTSGKHPHTHFR